MIVSLWTCFRRVASAGVLLASLRAEAFGQAKKGCSVQTEWAPSDAEKALRDGHFDEAQKLFAAMPATSEATAGQVRALLGAGKLAEAMTLAQAQAKAHPNDALLLDALGEARFRRGEVAEAAVAFNDSNHLDPCAARTYYDVSRYMNLNGLYKSAQAQLDLAHKLAPADPMILSAWQRTQRRLLTPEEQVSNLEARAARPGTTDEQMKQYEQQIKSIRTRQKGDCELATPVETANIDMLPIGNGATEQGSRASGLDVVLNGKRKRLELDTGASGLLITREAAGSLGLTPELEVKTYGIGDEGTRDAYVTHVESVRVGAMEFHNCMVRIIESRNVLSGQDGLIGADVFRSFVVTLDFPDKSLKLGPLPKRPDETAAAPATLATGGDEGGVGQTFAETRRDRYIAPEMKDWTKVFRYGHDLIFPTSIGKTPMKLFIMDTGAGLNLISPAAAREVTGVGVDAGLSVKGISGEVKTVAGTGPITLSFGGVSQYTRGMTSIDTGGLSRSSGTEISGFIGYPTLKELVIAIDYRDNLVKVTYTPHVGAPGLGSQR